MRARLHPTSLWKLWVEMVLIVLFLRAWGEILLSRLKVLMQLPFWIFGRRGFVLVRDRDFEFVLWRPHRWLLILSFAALVLLIRLRVLLRRGFFPIGMLRGCFLFGKCCPLRPWRFHASVQFQLILRNYLLEPRLHGVMICWFSRGT